MSVKVIHVLMMDLTPATMVLIAAAPCNQDNKIHVFVGLNKF
jgi:hypothetical protein